MSETRELVKFKLENETSRNMANNDSSKLGKKESNIVITINDGKDSKDTEKKWPIGSGSGTATAAVTNNSNLNNDEAKRFRSETVRKNWKIVLDMAMKKRTFDTDFMDRSESVSFNVGGFNNNQAANQEIYASDKENWIYFSIIITTVVILSILFCYLVYSFFPNLRGKTY